MPAETTPITPQPLQGLSETATTSQGPGLLAQETGVIQKLNTSDFISEPQANNEIGAGTIVATEEELLGHLQTILENPGAFSHEQARQIIADSFAGRSYQKVQQENPQLAKTLLEINRISADQAREYAAQMSRAILANSENPAQPTIELAIDSTTIPLLDAKNVSEVVRTPKDELELTVIQPDGEKVRVKTSALLLGAAIIAADLVFFQGANVYPLLQTVLTPSLNGLTQNFMARLGVDIPENLYNKSEVFDFVIRNMSTRALLELFHKFPNHGNQTHAFLAGMSEEERYKMLNGEIFCSGFQNHQLKTDEIEMILKKLSNEQKLMLHIKS